MNLIFKSSFTNCIIKLVRGFNGKIREFYISYVLGIFTFSLNTRSSIHVIPRYCSPLFPSLSRNSILFCFWGNHCFLLKNLSNLWFLSWLWNFRGRIPLNIIIIMFIIIIVSYWFIIPVNIRFGIFRSGFRILYGNNMDKMSTFLIRNLSVKNRVMRSL